MPADLLAENDVRAMVRLVGSVAGPGDHAVKKQSLMRGLCDLIGAKKWAWALSCNFAADRPPVYVGFLHRGFSKEEFACFLRACEHPDTQQTNGRLIEEFRRRQTHLTRRQEEIDPENRYADLPELRGLWERADVGAVIMSLRPIGVNGQSLIGVYRSVGAPPFTPRESRMAHIILSEVGWLHEQGWPEEHSSHVPRLSPRQRVTLNLLLDGQSRKEIADHLAISVNTVSGYVKDVYRHFGAQSHAELMSRFQSGDGGDLPR